MPDYYVELYRPAYRQAGQQHALIRYAIHRGAGFSVEDLNPTMIVVWYVSTAATGSEALALVLESLYKREETSAVVVQTHGHASDS